MSNVTVPCRLRCRLAGEATSLRGDRVVTKSNSNRALALLMVRALEAIVTGKAQTSHPQRHHGADDRLGLR
jgi:hypothetical protein